MTDGLLESPQNHAAGSLSNDSVDLNRIESNEQNVSIRHSMLCRFVQKQKVFVATCNRFRNQKVVNL